MADELKVDPAALHNGSNDMLDSVGEAALSFVHHEDGLADAAPGWIGSSQQALGELAARWEARHNHHKLQVGGLGSHMADAMTRYVSNEDESAQAAAKPPMERSPCPGCSSAARGQLSKQGFPQKPSPRAAHR